MKLIGKNLLDECKGRHAQSRKPIDRWAKLVEGAAWRTTADVKKMFGGNVDFVEGKTVFDVGGNKYRVVARVNYQVQLVAVTFAGDHGEYDLGKWK